MDKRSLKVLEFDSIKSMLLDFTVTTLGNKHVENLYPSVDRENIIFSQKQTSEAQKIILTRGNVPISALGQVSEYAKRASIDAILEPYQLLKISDTLRICRKVKNFLRDSENTPILQQLSENITILKDLEDEIDNAIISEEEISDNASPELSKIRRSITNTKEQIRQKLASIVASSQYSKYLQEAIVTMRQDRFVVPVKAENRSNVPGIVHDSSASGATLFIEPMAVVEMNNKLREYKVKEQEEIERILTVLSAMAGQSYHEILTNEQMIAEIDFIMAKGKLSVKMKAQEPFINSDLVMNLKNARHPLIDPKNVVPSNINIGKEFDTLVITGPNTGGKTVTLKTIGLFAIMAQSGLHLPTDYGTSICIFDNIFADIGDEQSIEQSLSTFSSHMTHIVNILDEVNDNCLVLFDELGAGTDPLEGAALAVSILDRLREYKLITVATTHYSELKHYALTTDRVENASVEFDVQTLSPTYRLLIGIPGKSNAFEISRKLGLKEEIILAAKHHLDSDSISMEDVLKEIDDNRKQIETEREQSKIIYEDAKKLQTRLKEKESKLDTQKDKIIQEAKNEARKLLQQAKEEADEAIKELRELSKRAEKLNINKEIEASRRKIKTSLDKYGYKNQDLITEKDVINPVDIIGAGDEVYVPSFSKNATVVSVDNEKKEALVQIGIMKLNLPFSSLERLKQNEDIVKSSGAGKIMKNKTATAELEIDLRGMDLETARIEVDKYLDNSYVAGLPRVTIIHGVGTLVLKNGIKAMLKSHKHVKSYRDGGYGEGGMGVTIVELK